MRSVQLSQEQIRDFEASFIRVIQSRILEPINSAEEAYNLYQKHSAWLHNVWAEVASGCSMERARAYKFYRFTWSRQFHPNIQFYKRQIKETAIAFLDAQHLENGIPATLNKDLWHYIWSQFQQYNLHFDSTDQLTRNILNSYITKHGYDMTIIKQSTQKEICNPILTQYKEQLAKSIHLQNNRCSQKSKSGAAQSARNNLIDSSAVLEQLVNNLL